MHRNLVFVLLCFSLVLSGCDSAQNGDPDESKTKSEIELEQLEFTTPSNVAVVNFEYVYELDTKDTDNLQLDISWENIPEWLAVAEDGKSIRGVPSSANIGIYPQIQPVVRHGFKQLRLPSFSIQVFQTDSAPRLTGVAPSMANEGENFYFLPSAENLDENSLQFFVENKPDWMHLNSLTGELSAQLDFTSAGIYHNIRVRVTDSQHTVFLPGFDLVVLDVNREPVAKNTIPTAAQEGTHYQTKIEANDPDGDVLQFQLQNHPMWLQINPVTGLLSGIIDYSAAGVYENIQVIVSDNKGGQTDLFFTLIVENTNLAPNTKPAIVSLQEDSTLTMQLVASDPDGDDLLFSIISGVGHGEIILLDSAKGEVLYRPNANYVGNDQFQFMVSDENGSSSQATVSLTIIASNDAPQAMNETQDLTEDQASSFQLKANDVEGDELRFSIITAPSHGSLQLLDIAKGSVRFLPNQNYSGNDYFVFQVSDVNGLSSQARVDLNIAAINDAPVANDSVVSVNEDQIKLISLSFDDVDRDDVTVVINDAPQHGSLEITSQAMGTVQYTPDENYHGSDFFTYHVVDAVAASAIARVDLSIMAINDKPSASPGFASVIEDLTATIQLQGADIDLDALTFQISRQAFHGSLNMLDAQTGLVQYTPEANYSGNDSFVFAVKDANNQIAEAQVDIEVQAVNDLPVASNSNHTINEDTQLMFQLLASDLDNDDLLYSLNQNVQHGNLELLNSQTGQVRYTPNSNYTGQDWFSFHVNDASAQSAIAIVRIDINPVNDAPSAKSDNVSLDEDNSIDIQLQAVDNDDVNLNYQIITQPQKGSISWVNQVTGIVRYIPNNDYVGIDQFRYRVSDAAASFDEAIIGLNINAVNDLPVAIDDSLEVMSGQSNQLEVLSNDSGLGDGVLQVNMSAAPVNGVASITNSGMLTYTANTSFTGSDVLSYEVTDVDFETTTASVNISVKQTCEPNCRYTVTVSWAANSEPDISGYRLYHGRTSRNYTSNIDTGLVTTTTYDLQQTGTHWFALTAVNNSGLESDFSDEASVTIP